MVYARAVGASDEGRVSGVEGDMKKSGLENFGAYCKSMELFDLVVKDMETLKGEYAAVRLVS